MHLFLFSETTQRTQMEDTKDRENSGDVLPEEQGSVRMGRRFDRNFINMPNKTQYQEHSIYTREKDIDGGLNSRSQGDVTP